MGTSQDDGTLGRIDSYVQITSSKAIEHDDVSYIFLYILNCGIVSDVSLIFCHKKNHFLLYLVLEERREPDGPKLMRSDPGFVGRRPGAFIWG